MSQSRCLIRGHVQIRFPDPPPPTAASASLNGACFRSLLTATSHIHPDISSAFPDTPRPTPIAIGFTCSTQPWANPENRLKGSDVRGWATLGQQCTEPHLVQHRLSRLDSRPSTPQGRLWCAFSIARRALRRRARSTGESCSRSSLAINTPTNAYARTHPIRQVVQRPRSNCGAPPRVRAARPELSLRRGRGRCL